MSRLVRTSSRCNALRAALLVGSWLLVTVGCSPTKSQLLQVQYAPQLREDWPVSTPEKQGLDPLLVAELYHDAAQLETVYGVLVIKDDQLIAEKYFNGSSIDHSNDRMSTTKSYTSALVGIALEQGCLESLDQKMVEFFPEYASKLGDARKSRLTIRELLQMRAGYPWEDMQSPYLEILYFSHDYDWLPRMASFPLTHQPGTEFAYSNLTSHIVGAIVARACDTDLMSFAKQHLFEPMGASLDDWHRAEDGFYFGAFGIFVSARDMAKFGQLYFHGGEYRGKRLLTQQWVQASLQPYSTDINFTGWFSSELGDYFTDLGYGYQWWTAKVNGRPIDFAWGHGGNLIVLVRDLHMLIVTTADPLYEVPPGASWQYEGAVIDVVGKFIESLPAGAQRVAN